MDKKKIFQLKDARLKSKSLYARGLLSLSLSLSLSPLDYVII